MCVRIYMCLEAMWIHRHWLEVFLLGVCYGWLCLHFLCWRWLRERAIPTRCAQSRLTFVLRLRTGVFGLDLYGVDACAACRGVRLLARVGVVHSSSPSLASRQEQVSDASQLAGGLAGATSGAANWRERQLAGAPTGGGVKRDPDGVGALGPTHPGGLAAAPSLASLTAWHPSGPVGAAPHRALRQWWAVLLAL